MQPSIKKSIRRAAPRAAKFPFWAYRSMTERDGRSISTVEAANRFYRKAISQGAKEMSIPLDFATYQGLASDDPRVSDRLGIAGIPIDSIEDMKILLRDIPLDEISIGVDMSGAVLPVFACLIAASDELGIRPAQLRGRLQCNHQTHHANHNRYIYPPEPSLRIIRDIIIYSDLKLPKCNSVSIAFDDLHPTRPTAVGHLARTLGDARDCLRAVRAKGKNAGSVASRISFEFPNGSEGGVDAATEVATQRVWHQVKQEFAISMPGEPLPESQNRQASPEAQHFDWSSRAENELATSNKIFSRSQEIAIGAICEEIRSLLLAREDTVSVNKLLGTSSRNRSVTNIRPIHFAGNKSICSQRTGKDTSGMAANDNLRHAQSARLKHLREAREQADCDAALSMIEASANIDKGNLLELAVEAMRARVTLGEISMVLEGSFGRVRGPKRLPASHIHGLKKPCSDVALDTEVKCPANLEGHFPSENQSNTDSAQKQLQRGYF